MKSAITAVEVTAIASAPLFAPAELGALATEEEVALSEAASIGEGASIVEVGEEAGEGVDGEADEGRSLPETDSGGNSESGSDDGSP